ncbi:MAG: hypothetical protein LBV36_05695 [Chromatiales bacterium]|nr:hypothetical protein [Chromatiales bacterium]
MSLQRLEKTGGRLVDKPCGLYDHGNFIIEAHDMPTKNPHQDVNASWSHAFIGQRVRHNGQIYEILEILIEEPALMVLQSEGHTTIQPDQHGEAHRRVPETITLPVIVGSDGEVDFAEMEVERLEDRAEPVA